MSTLIPSYKVKPGSKEWWKYITASQIAQGICANKYGGGPYALWLDSLLGFGEDKSMEPAIQHGVKYEPHARRLFSWLTGKPVAETPGMYVWDGASYNFKRPEVVAATPDGFVCGENSIIEIKCPYSKHEIPKKIPLAHYIQMQMTMLMTGDYFAYYIVFILDFADEVIGWKKVPRDDYFIGVVMGWLQPLALAWGIPDTDEVIPKRCTERKSRMEILNSLLDAVEFEPIQYRVPDEATYENSFS